MLHLTKSYSWRSPAPFCVGRIKKIRMDLAARLRSLPSDLSDICVCMSGVSDSTFLFRLQLWHPKGLVTAVKLTLLKGFQGRIIRIEFSPCFFSGKNAFSHYFFQCGPFPAEREQSVHNAFPKVNNGWFITRVGKNAGNFC